MSNVVTPKTFLARMVSVREFGVIVADGSAAVNSVTFGTFSCEALMLIN